MKNEQNIITVYAEATPNPDALKFVVNQTIAPSQPFDFRTVEDAEGAPLAQELFKQDFVNGVFIMNDFVSITKTEEPKWIELIPQIRGLIKKYIEDGKPVLTEALINKVRNEAEAEQNFGEDTESKIRMILDQHVKPAVEMDGGAIDFKSYQDGVVTLVLKGSCSGCPSSIITLKNGIEGLLQRVVPGVKEVVAEEG